ncbi:MAG: TerB family tellurite resistance protein [Bdellovibrionales bacterium]|nr:TerB family tellurite resistance protein [Bdellovibrionales bacterium]
MNHKSPLLGNAVSDIINRHQLNADNLSRKRHKGSQKANMKRELELAVTVLLVDLASSDQNFDQVEYHVIAAGLKRLFGTGTTEMSGLVNQAQTILKNLRGVGKYAEVLKTNLSLDQRKVVLEVIDDVIHADGVVDGFETYLRHKFADLIGVPLEPHQDPHEKNE